MKPVEQSAADFIAWLETTLAAWKAEHPEDLIMKVEAIPITTPPPMQVVITMTQEEAAAFSKALREVYYRLVGEQVLAKACFDINLLRYHIDQVLHRCMKKKEV